MKALMNEFDSEMAKSPRKNKLTARAALDMSSSEHFNDLYLARAYPFLYARKLRYVMASHWWEHFHIRYGAMGLHYVVLFLMSLIIILGYRELAQCRRFGGTILASPKWPQTCLINLGQRAANFSALRGGDAKDFVPVSCGVNGYVPSNEEWDANSDYFTSGP
jgi:hypothetical protein